MRPIPKEFLMKNFRAQEFVPPSMYQLYGDHAIMFMDSRLLACVQALRDQLGQSMSCNTWHVGGPRVASGIRIHGSEHFSVGSAHTYGMAADLVGAWDADAVRQGIADGGYQLPHSVRLEANVGWLHIDVYTPQPKYLNGTPTVTFFNP